MNHKNNRRVTMTKLILKESFLDMLETESLHQISIRALCENADINRSTFYKYYGSQYDLLTEMENDFLQEVDRHIYNAASAATDASTAFKIYILNILQVTKKNLRFCKLLLQRNIDPEFPKRLMYSPTILEELNKYVAGSDNPVETSYFHDCILFGGYQMIKRWVEEDCVIPEQQMLQIIENAYQKLLV